MPYVVVVHRGGKRIVRRFNTYETASAYSRRRQSERAKGLRPGETTSPPFRVSR